MRETQAGFPYNCAMTRETRSNLIFIAIFLAICLPGAVILVKKKMRPGASQAPLSRPDPVRRQLPYMAPQVTSDKVVRYVPPLTREWLMEVDRSRGGTGEFLVRDRLPTLSEDRSLQVLNLTDSTVTLILWEHSRLASEPTVEVEGRVVKRVERHVAEVPREVRRELQDGGFVDPPARVFWLRANVSPTFTGGRFVQVHVKSKDVANPAAKSVNLFTSSGF